MKNTKQRDRRTCLYGLAGGVIFAALTAMGYSLKHTDTIWHRETLIAFLCLTPLFGYCVWWLLRRLGTAGEGKNFRGNAQSVGKSLGRAGEQNQPGPTAGEQNCPPNLRGGDLSGHSVRKWYLICWLFLFLSWIPVLLASWPGIYSYDSGWQLASFVDGEVTGHHPILHTFLLGICMKMGQALNGSNQTGAVLYSLIQMALMSAMYAYACLYLKKRRAQGWLQVGSFLFFAFHPVNSLMALCATKDSIFTAVFAVFMVQLFEMLEDTEGFFGSRRRQVFFCLNVFFMFAFRNNAFHTFLLCIPVFLIVFRKHWKRMGLLILICLGLQLVYTGPVYGALGIEQGDPREMCSVLMQSAARAYNLDYLGLKEDEKEAFLSIIEEEGMESYLSWFADPVKAYFDGEKFVENPVPFMKAWVSVGLRHKKVYMDAFLANTYGYWYPGNCIPESNSGKDYFEYYCKDFREDVNVTMESKLPALSEFYRKIGNKSAFEEFPQVSWTFNLGTYTWILLFAILLLLYRRQYRELLLTAPLFMYFITTLLGPVVKMRYHYPLIACAPLILYLILRKTEPKEGPLNG